ncbi:hypothetical protein NUM3379_21590 [Kineococcus sp. NUM-3379]
MHRESRHTLLCAPLLATCLLTACSDPPEASRAEPVPPLSAYVQAFYGSGLSEEEQREKLDEESRRAEERIAGCMREQGFEYTPDITTTSASSTGVWDFSSRQFVSQYGYAVVRKPGQEDAGQRSEDPDAEYLESLSESERDAYQAALYGSPLSGEELAAAAEGDVDHGPAASGCSGEAYGEVTGENPMTSGTHAELSEAISDFYAEQPSWPELAEANSAWSDCMADAGHPGFTAQQDAQTSILAEEGALSAAPDVDQEALDDLGEEEVELALADLGCREETRYEEKFDRVAFEKEQQFVDDHRTELQAMKADAEQGR